MSGFTCVSRQILNVNGRKDMSSCRTSTSDFDGTMSRSCFRGMEGAICHSFWRFNVLRESFQGSGCSSRAVCTDITPQGVDQVDVLSNGPPSIELRYDSGNNKWSPDMDGCNAAGHVPHFRSRTLHGLTMRCRYVFFIRTWYR